MSKQLKLKIVTPEKLVLEELVESVTVPTLEGEITILPEHVPIIAGLKSGDIVALANGEHIPYAVVGGFVEVKNTASAEGSGVSTEVAILADFAEHISDITDEAIEKAKARSLELQKLAENKEVVDFEHFATELDRSLTRVKIADKWKTRKYRK
ncbi:MAG: ATP synthase F1 subunit epsilon [Candidatus Nomurabacteria bacterium]|nr:ATP synthase F1 subunit epsilon [Candidatus Nomurabacteria bacterium]